VEDGPSALELLRTAANRGEPYDLAILDERMSSMDGLELAQRIKADPAIASVQLVLLTSIDVHRDSEEVRQIGIAASLTKPVRQSQLFDCLATVMSAPDEAAADALLSHPVLVSESEDGLEETDGGLLPRILLAEDNAVNREVAVQTLVKLGYRVDVAKDGLEAIETLSHAPYAVVLMDCQMPRMDGYEATARIRQHEGEGHRTPIVAMTAHALQGEREKCLAAGMDDYISKPFQPDELDAVLERWIPQMPPTPEASALEETDGAKDTEGAIDSAVLLNLRLLQQGSKPSFLDRLIKVFLNDVPLRLATLREDIAQEEAQAIEQQAHALLGSCASLGAHHMASVCAELETIARSGDLRHTQDLLPRLEDEFDRTRKALTEELAS